MALGCYVTMALRCLAPARKVKAVGRTDERQFLLWPLLTL
jgi:hypothetical protein